MQLGDPGPALTVRSAYGPVRISELVRGVARIEASYGALSLGVRSGTPVWLDATSRHGVVRNGLTADAGPADGEASLELHARTGYGDITVHRAPAGAAARRLTCPPPALRRVDRLGGLLIDPRKERR